MMEVFKKIAAAYEQHPCRCGRCDAPLPLVHPADHLCAECRIVVDLEEILAILESMDILDASEEN